MFKIDFNHLLVFNLLNMNKHTHGQVQVDPI